MIAISTELLYEGLTTSQVAVSPDGRRIAYVVGNVVPGGPPSALWLAPADGSAAPHPLAERVSLPRWLPSSDALVCLVGGRLSVVRLDGSVTELSPYDGWIGEILPLPGGSYALVVEDDTPEPEGVRVWNRTDGAGGDRLAVVRPGDAAPRPLTALGTRHVVAAAAREDGTLAVASWDEPADEPGAFTARLHLVDPDADTALDCGALPHAASRPVWWHDGSRWHVALLATAPPHTFGGRTVLDIVPGEAPVDLTPDAASCPTELVACGRGLAGVFADGLDSVVRELDVSSGKFTDVARTEGLASTLACGGGTLAARISDRYRPNDVFVLRAGKFARVSDTRPHYRDVAWGTQERLTWRAADGLALDGLLLLPPGRTREDGPFPLLVLLHGGPYGRYADQLQFNSHLAPQWFADAGFAVLLPNPRGSEGRGPAFAASVLGDLGGAELGDVLAGVDPLVADGTADPARLSVAGWSHGGYLAAWAAARTDRFRAAVVGAGIADWGLQSGVGELGREDAALVGSAGWDGPGQRPHDTVSPVRYAKDITAPVLILHGEDDTNVPVAQATYLHRALRVHGIPHELAVYPGEGHALTGRASQEDAMRRARDFLLRHAG
ncbi:S9 family peptidase [Streptomyces sp. NBC_01262]|uniref:S9 family peptidase n=1 Tax=Streptomyces sp. NBC_01262 TaxID=2903803 RepID=UPI002E2F31ED|nr:prolyl oligopeptidase family serine peptidase [Streptomyces sp. NBC_01262]